MRLDDGAVDHVPPVIRRGQFRQRLQDGVPHPDQRPAPEALIDTVPFAVRGWKLSPLRTCPGNPQHALEVAAIVVRRPATAAPLRRKQRRNHRPFLVRNADLLAQRSISPKDESLNQKPSPSSAFVNKT